MEFELGHSIAEPSSKQIAKLFMLSHAIHQYISSQTISDGIYFQEVQGEELLGSVLCAQS